MVRRVAYLTAVAGVASVLAGCAMNFIGGTDGRASWREGAEQACMARHQDSPFIVKASVVDGRGACGISYPLKVSAFAEGSVTLGPDATLGCPITEAVDGWLREAVQPAAIAWFGLPVISIKQISDYSCRSRNNVHGAKLSEHAFGNALDVAGFELEDGRTILIKTGWRGSDTEQGFLREVEAAACLRFSTVLGPGAPYHGDHFHLDLARHSETATSNYCNPKPLVVPPIRAPYDPTRVAGPIVPASPAWTGSLMPADDPSAVGALPAVPRSSLTDAG
jgi:hypothetical protein